MSTTEKTSESQLEKRLKELVIKEHVLIEKINEMRRMKSKISNEISQIAEELNLST